MCFNRQLSFTIKTYLLIVVFLKWFYICYKSFNYIRWCGFKSRYGDASLKSNNKISFTLYPVILVLWMSILRFSFNYLNMNGGTHRRASSCYQSEELKIIRSPKRKRTHNRHSYSQTLYRCVKMVST